MSNYFTEREEVLAAARSIYAQNLVAGTWGNVSRRVAGQRLMVITPSGMDYDELCAEDMVAVDWELAAEKGAKYKPSSESPMHAAVYKAREDVGAVVHVHSVFACAYAAAGLSIPVILEETAQVIGHEIQTTPYIKCGTEELADAVAAALDLPKRAVLLANHGLVGVGADLSAAVKVCMIAERTAQISLYASVLGSVQPLPQADIARLQRGYKYYGQKKQKPDNNAAN